MNVAIIRYNAGNIQSVSYALERLQVPFEVTDDVEVIAKADKVIFPGVGEASSTMKYLRERKLDTLVKGLRQPVLGICLGMQLMCSRSEENDTVCMGIFDDVVRKFEPTNDLKVPHIGWNTLLHTTDWISADVQEKFVYFVHSYYVPLNNFTVATTEYVVPFSAGLRKDNFFAVQFHPEKSGEAGVAILNSFLNA